jgi:hypothetical protein
MTNINSTQNSGVHSNCFSMQETRAAPERPSSLTVSDMGAIRSRHHDQYRRVLLEFLRCFLDCLVFVGRLDFAKSDFFFDRGASVAAQRKVEKVT